MLLGLSRECKSLLFAGVGGGGGGVEMSFDIFGED